MCEFSDHNMIGLSVVILTLNEQEQIAGCLKSVHFADEILVIDSGSTDNTIEIAKRNGACVYSHKFTDFASQRNFSLSKAKGTWVLFVDADERVTPALASEIAQIVKSL